MPITHDMSTLVGFVCEAFLYGCNTILFAMSIHLMLTNARNRSYVNRPIFIISVLLFLSCSTHFALELTHFYKVLSTTGVKGFSTETKQLTCADLFISITDFIGGVILIYRCWLLWSKNYWIIILPSLVAIGSLVCITVVLAAVSRLDPNPPGVPQHLLSLGTAGFVLPLCSNVLVTTLIAVRIWHLSPRKAHDMQGTRFPAGTGRAAIDIVVESGMLYLVVQLIFVILFSLRHPGQDIASMMTAVQIYGIAPELIIIRVSLGLSDTSSRRFGTRGGSVSRSASTYVGSVRFRNDATDAGQRFAASPEVPMSQINLKSPSEDPDLTESVGTITNV